jgi:nucleoside-diphosphate-sugar epimerase
MNILVTGASGFLGRYTVAELLRRGHHIRAVVRPSTDDSSLPWRTSAELVRLDLEQPTGLTEALRGVDAVIHLAAAKTGSLEAQMRATVTATDTLLNAMSETGVRRLIAISTFSVYDYLNLPPNSLIDENTPLDANPADRDAYAQVKLIQEQRVRQFQQQGGLVTILRPGMVYGRDALWNACLGAKAGDRLWLRIGNDATLPLTYVENCAAAIANAVEREQAIGKTINIVDDGLPTQSTYANKLLEQMANSPQTLVINWTLMRLLSQLTWQTNKLLGKRLKLPGLLIPARLHARFKPLRYSNDLAKTVLAWTPQYSLDAALARSSAPEPQPSKSSESSVYSP